MTTPAAMALSGVTHSYGPTPALRGVDLRVEAGEVVAITGRSGSGKSTLLHVAAGLLRPQSGSVIVLGHDLEGLPEADRARLRRSQVAVILQFGQLVDELSGVDNVALPLMLDGRDKGEARGIAREWLARCGADDVADAQVPQMSGGQAQRVAVARALITRPALLLADEPTGSLDSLGGRALLDLLLAEVAAAATTLVIVTHDNEVAARASREVRLVDGVVASDTVLGESRAREVPRS